MINPIYKFMLAAGTSPAVQVFPVWGDGLAKEWERQQGEMFFREKLSGELIFKGNEADSIVSAAFDTKFVLELYVSYDNGDSWTAYWSGEFWKTDCEFNDDDKTVKVTPSSNDNYTAVLAGIDREFDLIQLAPEIRPFKFDKRAMLQIYVAGQSVIGCYLSNMWWEEECTAVSSDNTLTTTYYFSKVREEYIAEPSGTISPEIGDIFHGEMPATAGASYSFNNGAYRLEYAYLGNPDYTQRWRIIRESDDVILWEGLVPLSYPFVPDWPTTVTLSPQNGATGTLTLTFSSQRVYARLICDVDSVRGNPTSTIPSPDIVSDNRNYSKVINMPLTNSVWFSDELQSDPTQWGIYQPGQYYKEPYVPGMDFYPVGRNGWGRLSVWFTPAYWLEQIENESRKETTMKDAYPLWSVISVLLGQIAPGITHQETTAYSRFLYRPEGNIRGIYQCLMITPKSNVVVSTYDQPAQKAPITLREVLDMLRDCFRCYWFIDSAGRFRIEHVQFFRNGLSYGTSIVGVDLTAGTPPKINKSWAYATAKYKFEKPEMAGRYEFGWMDDSTDLFDGFPIDIISGYVDKEKIEKIEITNYTSDIDYMLLNPGDISKDGFALFAAQETNEMPSPETITGPGDFAFDFSPYAGQTIKVGLYTTAPGNVTVRQLVSGNYVTIGTLVPGSVQFFEFTVADGVLNVDAGGPFMCRLNTIYAGDYKLPYRQFTVPGHVEPTVLQNALVSFAFLQDYYIYDMPARDYKIGDDDLIAAGVKKLKVQDVIFPAYNDPDVQKLVKTSIGNGTIEKISVNLSSRRADTTLSYQFDEE